jgi:hypothetical protein
VSSVAGRTGDVTLAVADVSGAVSTSDSRLTDSRTPSSTLAHKASHATGGTDALAPSDISAAWQQTISSITVSSAHQLTAARNQRVLVNDTVSAGSSVAIFYPTSGNAEGDRLEVVYASRVNNTQPINVRTGQFDYTGSQSINLGYQRTFIYVSGAWVAGTVEAHTHDAAEVASGIFNNARINFASPAAIGNTAPAAGSFTTLGASGDIEVTDSTKGMILKSPNNTRWRLTINDDGTLSRAALALMTLLALATSGFAQVRDMVTDTNGNIVTGRTNVLTFTNRVSIPISSGAAATNSILTADGAGGSSFVASRVQRVTMTNNFAVTNYTDLSVATGNVPGMTVNLDANSLYVARWHVLITCGAEGAQLQATAGATNGIPDQSVAGRLGRPGFSYGDTYFLGSGSRRVMSLIGFSAGGFTSGVTNGVFNGVAQFRTGVSNTTLFWRFSQNSASNVATTLLSNSIFYVEKLSP